MYVVGSGASSQMMGVASRAPKEKEEHQASKGHFEMQTQAVLFVPQPKRKFPSRARHELSRDVGG